MSKKRDKIPPEQAERLKAMAQVVRGDPAEEEARIRAHERLRLEERDAHAARAAKREEDREAAIAQIKAANEQRMAEIRANLPETYFAWSGPTDNGSVAYFRIQGPTLVIEYAPQGNSVDHIHTIYRDPTNDYGAKFTKK